MAKKSVASTSVVSMLFGLLCVLGLLLGSSQGAFATEAIKVPNDDVKVYANPNSNSPVISVLKKGQTVTAGVNPGGGFKKVLVTDAAGKKVIGYVNELDLKAPIFPVSPEVEKEKKSKKNKKDKSDKKDKKDKSDKRDFRGYGLRSHVSVGVTLGITYDYQSISSLTDAGGNSASLSGLSGTNLVMGLASNIPINPRLNLGVDFTYKSLSMTGTGTASGTTQVSSIVYTQKFLALAATAKWYGDNPGDWWWGGGAEYELGNSGTIQYGSKPTYGMQSGDLKNFYFIYLATGYDFASSKTFYITPYFRAGAIPNGSPMILEFDFFVSGVYRF